MSHSLKDERCIPCTKGELSLKGKDIDPLKRELQEGWQIIQEHHLEKSYKFKDFKSALIFVDKVGEIAEQEGHHPDIFLSWGKVELKIWTHKIGGLSRNDFILAVKCDEVFNSNK